MAVEITQQCNCLIPHNTTATLKRRHPPARHMYVDVHDTATTAKFVVCAAEYYSAHLQIVQAAGAHDARLHGDKQRALLKVETNAVHSKHTVHGHQFSVSRGVSINVGKVPATGELLLLCINDDAPDGHFAELSGYLRRFQCNTHPSDIRFICPRCKRNGRGCQRRRRRNTRTRLRLHEVE